MEIRSPFPISKTVIERYKTQGYIKIKDVFSPEELATFEKKIDSIVLKEKVSLPPLAQRDT